MYLEELRNLLSRCLIQNPVRKNLKQFKASKYVSEYKVVRQLKQLLKEYKKTTQKGEEENPPDKKQQQKEVMQEFYEKIRNYMIKNHLCVHDIIMKIKGDLRCVHEDNEYTIEGVDKYLNKDDFASLFQELISQKQLSYEDCNKYYEAFLASRNKQKEFLDMNKFLAKLIDHIESKKIGYDKQELKKSSQLKEQQPPQIQSQMIKNTYSLFLKHYSCLIEPNNHQNFYRLDRIPYFKAAEQIALKLVADDVDIVIQSLTHLMQLELR